MVLICSHLRRWLNCRRKIFCIVYPGWQRSCCDLHTGALIYKQKIERSSEPYKFTTSGANIKSMPRPVDVNPYEKKIVLICLITFGVYWLYLREENDIDDAIYSPLFETVPHLEEPHLRQLIPRMKKAGEDTTEVEARLKVLVKERQEREAASK